jgi:hypothetical protein
MEHVNAGGALLESAGKYDVVREIDARDRSAQLPSMNALTLPAPGGRGRTRAA